jgi:hypothetical protein
MKAIDIEGQRFGRLVAQAVEQRGGHQRKWLCVGDCGRTVSATSTRLMSGDTQSCGCLRKETAKRQGLRNATHGQRKTATYRTWVAMISRCTNDKDSNWVNYGGRGVEVCDRWFEFENFLKDMGERPEGKTIDRKDVNGNYEPDNCRWATAEQQNNNRRTSRFIEFEGREQTLAQWARELGVTPQCLTMRLRVWPKQRALTSCGVSHA